MLTKEHIQKIIQDYTKAGFDVSETDNKIIIERGDLSVSRYILKTSNYKSKAQDVSKKLLKNKLCWRPIS